MSDLDGKLERMQADGRITTDDADEVRNFASFLEAAGPPPKNPGFDAKRFGDAYRDHYPEDFAKAITEEAVRRRLIPEAHSCATCPECVHDGNKCCGCYDGACCQTTAPAPTGGTESGES